MQHLAGLFPMAMAEARQRHTRTSRLRHLTATKAQRPRLRPHKVSMWDVSCLTTKLTTRSPLRHLQRGQVNELV